MITFLVILFLSPLVILPPLYILESRGREKAIKRSAEFNRVREASERRYREAWFAEEERLAAIRARVDAERSAVARIVRRVVGYGLLGSATLVLLCALLHSLGLT